MWGDEGVVGGGEERVEAVGGGDIVGDEGVVGGGEERGEAVGGGDIVGG